jgi:hypothetical protein
VSEPRILLYDIETSPNLGYVWGKWQQNILEFEQEWYILSVAWKWLGEKTVHVTSLPKYETYDRDPTNDIGVVQAIWSLFNEADVVVAHNGNHFDQPKARTRMLIHQMPPPEPFLEVDTLTLAKRHFKFTSNRLDDLCQVLDIGRKAHHLGFSTWMGCLEGDEKAWKTMTRYNKQDVVLLEELYLRLRPWAKQHPNLGLISNTPDACPKCLEQGTMRPKGWAANAVTRRRRYQCSACQGWSLGRPLHKSDVEYVN